eukprot:959288-Prorocentrum_minimum.AAC.1
MEDADGIMGGDFSFAAPTPVVVDGEGTLTEVDNMDGDFIAELGRFAQPQALSTLAPTKTPR